MSDKILVTDSLFISDKHVKELEAAGFEVERLDKPKASEEELCVAVKGKAGYLLGGIEKITDKVIEAADELRAIVITGTGYKGFVPGYELALQKGIAIGTAPHKNAHAVAEFGMTMSLIMSRDAIALARGNEKTFETTRSLSELAVGVIGLGHIGTIYTNMAQGMGVKDISYFSRTRKPELEADLGIKYKAKADLFKECDLIFAALPMDVGENFFTADEIDSLKPGSIIVSIGNPDQFELDALFSRLESSSLRVAFDDNIKQERFQNLPLGTFYTANESTAFNTVEAIETVSESCVQTMINLLKTGADQYRIT